MMENKKLIIKKFKLGDYQFKFVLRHKWDEKLKFNPTFRDYRIGVWFKKSEIVGRKDFTNVKKWGKNLVNDYTIGFDLLVIKIWVSFNKGGMVFK